MPETCAFSGTPSSRSVQIEFPIGERIPVTVARVKGKQVRLAIDGPKHLPVVREELLDRVESS